MKRLPLSLVVFVVGLLASASQNLLLGPKLPAQIASNFGIDGRPNGYMSRESFLMYDWITIASIAALFFVLTNMFRFFPTDRLEPEDKLNEIPREQRPAVLAYMSNRMYVFGSATLALIISVFQLIYQANITGTFRMSGTIWVLFALYLAYIATWVTSLTRWRRLSSASEAR
jgi:hypothetical protein